MPDEALATLRQGARLHPRDGAAAQLARTFIARGDLATAAEYLTWRRPATIRSCC